MAKTMLLIEDSLTIQEIALLAFEDTDYEVITVNNAADGLHRLRSLVPDLIVADAGMPDLNGFQLCQMIRDTTRLRHVPVVLLTSNLSTYDNTQGDRAGVSGHLAKPFEPAALRQLVQQVLARAALGPRNSRTLATDMPASWPSEPPPFAWLDTPEATGGSRARNQESPSVSLPVRGTDMPQDLLLQTLGQSLILMLRDALNTHLDTLLTRVTPQLLEAVREKVDARLPELLEALLQQEIDKLKQAVADDEQHGDQ